MKNDSCIFCKIAKKEVPSKIIFENSDLVAFEDISPQAPVHVVIISKAHIEKLSDVTEKDIRLMGSMVLAAKDIAADKGISGSGYRVVMNCNKDGGQAVFHIHLHLLGGRKLNWPPG
ncbi:MAG: histidine triad nucleotide-binding protein [Candidatus Omnitrophota bacterium]|jgi:histidine triad (HIT) family protein